MSVCQYGQTKKIYRVKKREVSWSYICCSMVASVRLLLSPGRWKLACGSLPMIETGLNACDLASVYCEIIFSAVYAILHFPQPPPVQKITRKIQVTNVSSCELHRCVSVHVRQQAQAEAFRVGRISKTIHCHRGLGGMKRLPDSLVELIVGYRAPESWLTVGNRLQIWPKQKVNEKGLRGLPKKKEY